jgi:hypothetical protein
LAKAILTTSRVVEEISQFSAISAIWHGLCKSVCIAAGWSGRRIQGVQEMTFNLGNLQQFAVSAIGALFAATLFISAAVGPVGQFI